MDLTRVKEYTSTAILDKFKNPLAFNDIVLSGGKLSIFLGPIANTSRVLIGFTDGKISKVLPEKLIRLDVAIEQLKKNSESIKNTAVNFCDYKERRYVVHCFMLTQLASRFRSFKYKNKFYTNLFTGEYDKEIYTESQTYSSYGIAYGLNGKWYSNKYDNIELVHYEQEPYINPENPKEFVIATFEYWSRDAFLKYKTQCYELIRNIFGE